MKKKVLNPYFLTLCIGCLIGFLVFFEKGIYPFGENTLIYGDMYDQITAFYYHFYDIFHGNASLFMDFTTGGGMNFWGIFAYYIASPFSILLLFFKRENLYLAISILVLLKAIFASLTCLYSVFYFSKKKCPNVVAILLSLSYAFSGYFFYLYQITSWMDAMYLFPLLMVGLKKVIDLENPCFYIVTLWFSIITSFYVSYMSLILIILFSFFYIFTQKEKNHRKKSIVLLGISTILVIGASMFITLPSIDQILSSSRISSFSLDIFRSGVGPIQDKLAYLFPSSFLIISVFLLIIKGRSHSKFLKWYIPCLVVLLLPYFVEPIHKLLHFSSYAAFPVRYGYITCYFLVLGALYYILHEKPSMNQEQHQIHDWLLVLGASGLEIFLTIWNYSKIQKAIASLSIFSDEQVFWILFGKFFILSVVMIVIFQNRKGHTRYFLLLFLSMVQIICNAFLFLGISSGQKIYQAAYQEMNTMYAFPKKEGQRLKNNTSSLVTNNGMVTGYPNLDHFTSLVDEKTLHFLKQLGYSSHWMKIHSKNGTLFADSIFSNQYYLTKNRMNSEWYEYQKRSGKYRLYKLKSDLPFGYFTEDITSLEREHSFSLQNKMYRAITGKDHDLFNILNDFHARNLDVITKEERTFYRIKDSNAVNYLELEVPVTNQAILYLEVFNSLENLDDQALYEKMRIYVNHKLFKEKYPLITNNGCLNLGEYEGETILIQIELLENISLSYLEVGVLPVSLMKDFLENQKVDSTVSYRKNQIMLNVESEREGLFFIPVPYSSGYHAKVNEKNAEVLAVYDHFLGVQLEKGHNTIQFTYVPPRLKEGVWISVISLLFAIAFLFRYKNIFKWKRIEYILQFLYLDLVVSILFFIYFVSFVCFILSFFFYIY